MIRLNDPQQRDDTGGCANAAPMQPTWHVEGAVEGAMMAILLIKEVAAMVTEAATEVQNPRAMEVRATRTYLATATRTPPTQVQNRTQRRRIKRWPVLAAYS